MHVSTSSPLRIGSWDVHPDAGQLSRGDETVRVEARTMRLLLYLATRADEVVSIDELLSQVWAGVVVTPDSVYQAVTALRRLLGDDPKQPAYIVTVPRRGYRLIAAVDLLAGAASTLPSPVAASPFTPPTALPARGRRPIMPYAMLAALLIVLISGLSYAFLHHRASAHGVTSAQTTVPNPKSIAVLPFLDLTDTMNEEPFADGMTEELIDRLSKFQGLQVSAPTASFYFKDKQLALTDIARSLGVSYVLDGSVRKSGNTLRIAARLVHANDGFVVWSGSYDRPLGDKLKVQDEIADEVTKALKNSFD